MNCDWCDNEIKINVIQNERKYHTNQMLCTQCYYVFRLLVKRAWHTHKFKVSKESRTEAQKLLGLVRKRSKGEKSKRIIEIMKKDPNITNRQLKDRFNVSMNTIKLCRKKSNIKENRLMPFKDTKNIKTPDKYH